MTIKPSAAIRKNYNEIADLCKTSGEPIYLTRNGEGDLVVMDIEAFARRESMLHLRERLVEAEESRLNGNPGHSIEDVVALMQKAVQETLHGSRQ